MKDWKLRFMDKFGTSIDGGILYPLEVMSFIKSLLSEQEEEHKKQMREAIEEAFEAGKFSPRKWDTELKSLFKKYNCEESKDAE